MPLNMGILLARDMSKKSLLIFVLIFIIGLIGTYVFFWVNNSVNKNHSSPEIKESFSGIEPDSEIMYQFLHRYGYGVGTVIDVDLSKNKINFNVQTSSWSVPITLSTDGRTTYYTLDKNYGIEAKIDNFSLNNLKRGSETAFSLFIEDGKELTINKLTIYETK